MAELDGTVSLCAERVLYGTMIFDHLLAPSTLPQFSRVFERAASVGEVNFGPAEGRLERMRVFARAFGVGRE